MSITVAEMIEILRQFPQDAQVYRDVWRSEPEEIHPDDITCNAGDPRFATYVYIA